MKFLLLSILLIIALDALSQSGWSRRKNTYFAKLAASYFQSSDYYNLNGEEMTTSVFRQNSWVFYGEYGITDRLTTILHAPVLKSNGFETTNTVYGIGDLKVEFKYQLFKNAPVSISVAPEFPTGSRNNFATNKTNPSENINLPTGDGEFNVWTTLAGSASFHPIPAYATISVAHNYRTRYDDIKFRDQIMFSFEGGYKLADLIWINATIRAQESLGKPSGVTDFLRGDGVAFTAVSLGASFEFFKGWSISTQVWGYNDLIFIRKNIYSSPTFSLGVFYEIK